MLPKNGISCRACQPDVSLPVNGDNPGFGGLLGASPPWAVPGTGNLLGTGPDLPPLLSLSHFSPPTPSGHLLPFAHVHMSMCAHRSPWFSERRRQVVERQDEPQCNFISVVLLSSCHGKSILLVTL